MSQHDDEEEDRRAILARKAMFIASAMSGIALLDGCSRPQPCLSVIPTPPPEMSARDVPEVAPPDATLTVAMTPEAGLPEPMPCLSVALPPEDAGAPMTPEAGLPAPMPCLSVAASRDAGTRRDGGRARRPPEPPQPQPEPCLSLMRPEPCLRVAPHTPMPFKPDEGE